MVQDPSVRRKFHMFSTRDPHCESARVALVSKTAQFGKVRNMAEL